MPFMLIRQKVSSIDAWLPRFEAEVAARRAFGSQGCRVFTNIDDPTEVVMLFEWDDLDRARLFVQSDDFQIELAREASFDQPVTWYLESAGEQSG